MISRSQIMRQMFVVALTAAACAVAGAPVYAQETQGVDRLQELAIEQAAALNAPLTGGRMPILSGPVDDELPADYSAPPASAEIPKLPPMKGFQQMADSPVMKKMLKKLITAEVPVMYQTMMMVENGAATGFIGSMNTVSNLMSNTVQSQQFQLNLFDAAVSDNEHKRAYVKSVYTSQNDVGDNKDIWPAALFYASGDIVEEGPGRSPMRSNITKFSRFTENKDRPSGSSPMDLVKQGAGSGSGSSLLAGGGASSSDFKLSEYLFRAQPGESPAPERLSEFKQDLVEWVGDYSFKSNQNNGTDKVEHILAQPTKQRSSMYRNGPMTRGYEYKLIETQEDVWKKLNSTIKKYCQFKKNGQTYGKNPLEKERASSAITPDDWKGIQARDINITVNLVDQFFKLLLSRKTVDELDCDSFGGVFPQAKEIARDSGSFDECKPDSEKLCLRTGILVRFTEFIAKSKTDHFFKDLWHITAIRASVAQNYMREAEYLFCANLHLGLSSIGYDGKPICDPSLNFESRIARNREQWMEFVEKFGALAQGQGGASAFRSDSNNLSGVANP
jgi:hypothetical protein